MKSIVELQRNLSGVVDMGDIEVKKRYEKLKSMVTVQKEGFSKLMTFLETETDWLKSPASTKFHLCKEGGLLEHSCNVAETLLRIKGTLAPHVTDECCVIVGLLHDLGKIGMPGNPQYIKNEPTERQKQYGYPASIPYAFNTNLTYLSVPIRSIYLLYRFIKLTEEEMQAIVYHDGQYVDDNASVATKETPLTLMLQYSDTWSSFVIEKGK